MNQIISTLLFGCLCLNNLTRSKFVYPFQHKELYLVGTYSLQSQNYVGRAFFDMRLPILIVDTNRSFVEDEVKPKKRFIKI